MMRQDNSLELAKKPRPGTDIQQSDKIALWQQTATAETESDDGGLVAQLVRVCDEALLYLSSQINTVLQSRRHLRALRRHGVQLRLWADGHGVWDGSLDKTLAESKHLQYTTLAVLNSLCKTLSEGLVKFTDAGSDDVTLVFLRSNIARAFERTRWLIQRNDELASDSGSDSDSTGSDDEVPQSALADLAGEVKTLVDCLFDLSAAIERPATDPRDEDEPSALDLGQRAAHDYHADLIKAKYPEAQAELIECLGRTSWNRYQRMQQERDQNAEAAQIVSGPSQDQSAVKSQAASSNFKDSGVGSSIPSVPPARYAETVVSFMTGLSEGKRVSIPTLSAEARKGELFDCNACGRQISVTSNREWRQHLYLDLQPYTCFHVGCNFSTTPFANRQLWSHHLGLDHAYAPEWSSIVCPLCREATSQGKSAILIHFARHMEDIALAAIPRDMDSDEESNDETDAKSMTNSEPSEAVAAHASSPTAHFLSQINDGHHALSPVPSWAMGTPTNEEGSMSQSGSRSGDSDDERIPESAHHTPSARVRIAEALLAVPYIVSHRLVIESVHLQEASDILKTNPEFVTWMDQKPFHPHILNDSVKSKIPPEVKTWGQLKQFIATEPKLLPELNGNTLPLLQALQSLRLEILPDWLPEKGQAESSSEHGQVLGDEMILSMDEMARMRVQQEKKLEIEEWLTTGSKGVESSTPAPAREGLWGFPPPDERLLNTSNDVVTPDGSEFEAFPSAENDKALEIKRRCTNSSPPIPTRNLSSMKSYQTAIEILEPLDDREWNLLKQRLLAELSTTAVDQTGLVNTLTSQLEHYFSTENVRDDMYLRQLMDDRGSVPVEAVATFNRIKNLSTDLSLIRFACEHSDIIELLGGEDSQHRIRRKDHNQLVKLESFRNEVAELVEARAKEERSEHVSDYAQLTVEAFIGSPEALPRLPVRKPIPRKGHNKSRRGCFHCKRRRITCPENRPNCNHCIKAGLDCQYPVNFSSCLQCRSRRVKCDEKTPECSQCVRAGKQCQYDRPSLLSSMIKPTSSSEQQVPAGSYSTSPVRPFPPSKASAPIEEGIDKTRDDSHYHDDVPSAISGGSHPTASPVVQQSAQPPHRPVSPDNQYPPCNTLRVGNLPLGTSEDELEVVFSKQRGCKRICFRTKQNGPMCSVEFHDIALATAAMNDLNGYRLNKSVDGGIRLTFAKNPLGVRSGQDPGPLNTTSAADHNKPLFNEGTAASMMKCICGFPDNNDKALVLLCEGCGTWQHMICFYGAAKNLPDVHECTECAPRIVPANVAMYEQMQRGNIPEVEKRESGKESQETAAHLQEPVPDFTEWDMSHDFDSLEPSWNDQFGAEGLHGLGTADEAYRIDGVSHIMDPSPTPMAMTDNPYISYYPDALPKPESSSRTEHMRPPTPNAPYMRAGNEGWDRVHLPNDDIFSPLTSPAHLRSNHEIWDKADLPHNDFFSPLVSPAHYSSQLPSGASRESADVQSAFEINPSTSEVTHGVRTGCPVIGCMEEFNSAAEGLLHSAVGHEHQQLKANTDGTFSIVGPLAQPRTTTAELNVPHDEQAASPGISAEAQPQPAPKTGKRQFANRKKTGCRTCRRRKKRCDEAKPECNNCTRGGFVCEGYGRIAMTNVDVPAKPSHLGQGEARA